MENNRRDPIQVGIIGCGRISGHHCEAIKKTPGFALTALCDLDVNKAMFYADKHKGVKCYQKYSEMLEDCPDIKIVVIATPSGMHYTHAMDILSKYKKNLIIEKPTFMKPSEVLTAYSLAKNLGLSIFPVFQNRENLAVQRVLEGLKNNELGRIQLVSVRVRWCRPQKYYDLSVWRGTYSMDGGCLTNQGVHHIDLLTLFGGDIKKVISSHKTLGAEIEVEDTGVALIEFDNGALGTIEITTAARPIDYEASISIVGNKGVAEIGGVAVNELSIYTPDEGSCKIFTEDFSGNVYGNGHEKIYKNVYECMVNGKKYPIPLDHVYSTIKTLDNLYKSDELNAWVDFHDSSESVRLGRHDQFLKQMYM